MEERRKSNQILISLDYISFMEAYTGFAAVYDTFMDNVPYQEWAEYLIGLLREYGVESGLVCELGCGTGNITRRLRDAGYNMIGIDLSEDMLEIARRQEQEESFCEPEKECSDILYLNQDMREFELYGTVAAVVSLCDSINYLTSKEELLQVFRLVNNYLDPGGIFIFDMNTVHKYRDIVGDTTIAENREDCSLIWENAYDEKTGINQYDITIFNRVEFAEDEDELPPLFERITETHLQRAYPEQEIAELLEQAGMEFITMYKACTKEPVTAKTERIYFIAREKHQKGKLYVK